MKIYKVSFKPKTMDTHAYMPTHSIDTALDLARRELECGHNVSIEVQLIP